MKSKTISLGWAAFAALALVAGGSCKGHVEKNADGEVTSVGVKSDPEVTEKVKDAGEEVAAAGKAVGAEVQKGAKAVERAAGDVALIAKVKAKLLADPEVKGLAIEVDASGGKVILKGKVDSREQKQEAGKLARGTEGVRDVRNRIKVAGGG